jgi:ATP-binding cassette subfamily F protein 3
VLHFDNICLRRGPRVLFEGSSFQIHPGQKVGVTGANGTGKSSLFALIRGQLQSDEGELSLPSDWVVAHLAQEIPADNRPAIEFVLDGDGELRRVEAQLAAAEAAEDGETVGALHGRLDAIGGYAARSRAGQLLHGLGFAIGDEDRAVEEFSGGWRMRLNLAQALMCRSDLLLLDEPTNHLDLDAVIWVENWLRDYPGTLLMISHDREFLDSVVDRIAHIEHQKITLYTGNYSAFERQRAAQLANQQAEYEKQQREVAHMRAYVDRFRAKASKARQAQSRLKALERMELIAPAHVDSPFHFRFRAPLKAPDPLLQLDRCSAGYGERTVLSSVNLTLGQGDRVGLLGPNGAGKSTLIKFIAGELVAQSGTRAPAKDTLVGYFAQHQVEQLVPAQSPLEHLQLLDSKAREQELRNFLGGFGFIGDQALAPTGPFSGGEKSRLVLAMVVYQRPNLLLLDEPTNHLDLEMRQALATALQDFQGAMVLVSHDRHLLRVSCDQLLLVHGGEVKEFEGSLDDYPQWLMDRDKGEEAAMNKPDGAHTASARKDRKRQEAEWRRTLDPLRKSVLQAESNMDALHRRQQALQRQLAEPDIYEIENKESLKRLLNEKAELDKACSEAEELWMELSEKLELTRSELLGQG